ncbi:hypothetical protein CWE08_06840 [Aliidiomarina iranensis]|uniref:YdbS-like PH domain-containing protein n=1 Tax=Aliidiomarina iranensis TaxID=1434071 RepID=A0A432VWH4_9GAMM|nr:PH domain-containing protein [Aliidiomarina iranensis]RUO20811.1 hypothetical protein CWE08_06840 [Aliidiomarina iranensis]
MNSETLNWQRLPLISLIFFFISSVRLTIKHLYNALPGLVAIFVGLRSLLHWWPVAVGAIFIILLLATFLRYRRFSYVLEAERIRVRQGVFKRSELNLDYDRIQQADIRRPIWFKPFKLAILQLQSAGSKGSEVEVAGLSEELAERLQRDILNTLKVKEGDSEGAGEYADGTVDFELKLPRSEILRVGLIQNALLVVGVLAALLFSNEMISSYVIDRVESFVASFNSVWQAALVLTGIGAAALVVVLAGAILFFFNQYYGYHLQRQGDRVAYTAGLIGSLSRSFRIPKLQLIEFRQGLVARILSRWQLRILQAGGINDKAEGRFTVPVLHRYNRSLISDDLQLPEPHWHRVHKILIPRYWLIPSVIVGWVFNPWAGVGVAVLILLLRVLWWRNFAWHYHGGWIAVKSGLFGVSERWAPAAKMQRVRISSNPFSRYFNLCTLTIDTAGGSLSISCMAKEKAEALQRDILALTAHNNKRWM